MAVFFRLRGKSVGAPSILPVGPSLVCRAGISGFGSRGRRGLGVTAGEEEILRKTGRRIAAARPSLPRAVIRGSLSAGPGGKRTTEWERRNRL